MFDILKFSAYIAKLRKSMDMTQSELADKINITRQAVSKYERGDSFPDISILLLIADVFGVSVESLIHAGEPTKTEAEILLYQASGDRISTDELVNIAPFIKPSVLDRFTKKLWKQGIDITHLVALSEYMNTKSVSDLMDNTNTDALDEELLKRLIPVLSEESKLSIFEKIIAGSLDWHYIEILLPFAEYITSQIEAAVVEGALPWEALESMRKAWRMRYEREMNAMKNIFICPSCGHVINSPSCYCGYTVPYNNGVYQLTDDPYIVNDDSAEVKYIGYEDIGEAYSGSLDLWKMRVCDEYKKAAQIVGDGVLLDLACGDGLYTVPLLSEGVEVIAMDISDKMLSLLYKRAEISGVNTSRLIACRANALKIPLIDCSVDAVIANGMLHLISKPEIVVNEIYRVLKKGGKYITFDDKPTSGELNISKISPEEMVQNKMYSECLNFIHCRYFEILSVDYGIRGVRHSWKFDREKLCSEIFPAKKSYTIQKSSKMSYTLKDDFVYRMKGKGYSDQSDVPQDIHKTVFERVMSEFTEKYGEAALDTVFTGYENDIEMTVYIK